MKAMMTLQSRMNILPSSIKFIIDDIPIIILLLFRNNIAKAIECTFPQYFRVFFFRYYYNKVISWTELLLFSNIWLQVYYITFFKFKHSLILWSYQIKKHNQQIFIVANVLWLDGLWWIQCGKVEFRCSVNWTVLCTVAWWFMINSVR